jgi:NAD+ synthase
METSHQDPRAPLRLNMDLVRDVLVRFVRDETRRTGFERVVLGLSGGVDSAVVAAVAAEALGKENLLAVLMPYRTSNPSSIADARLIADALGLRTEFVDISPMVDAYCDAGKIENPLRRGNVMARMRMIVLYDLSARERALVLGTSNKTELMLGYGTQHGDLASAINPIGDLYKTQVWQLAEALGIPRTVIDKKPSADLVEGQTDEGDFGFTYADADALLFQMIDERRSDDELVKLGMAPAFIAKVRTMVRVNQFKRRPPVIAKISYRTVNVDFRYVRDWGT